MSKTQSLTITLPESLSAFVRERVDAQRYASASDVVRDALTLLEHREREREAVIAEIREQIEVGFQQAEAGQLRDGEAVFAKLFERHRVKP